MDLVPFSTYRYAFRFDDRGNDVGVLQLNLPGAGAVDGVFGKQTEAAVRDWQSKHKLVEDGVAGLATQQSLIVQTSRPIGLERKLPAGMLKSIAFNECGFAIAAAGPHLNDNGWDVGAFMRSSGASFGSPAFHLSAFNVRESAEWTADKLVSVREGIPKPVASRYREEMASGRTPRFRWQLAVLSHNWPYAAHNIATIGTALKEPGADDEPQDWIIAATHGRLRTPRQWVMAYVAKATVFVRWG